VKYLIVATSTNEYEIEVEAEDEQAALATLDDWIADDFQDYAVQGTWDFDVLVNE
jgi:hypothetical protein